MRSGILVVLAEAVVLAKAVVLARTVVFAGQWY